MIGREDVRSETNASLYYKNWAISMRMRLGCRACCSRPVVVILRRRGARHERRKRLRWTEVLVEDSVGLSRDRHIYVQKLR